MTTYIKSNIKNVKFIVMNIENKEDIEKAENYKQQNKYIFGFVPEDIKVNKKKIKSAADMIFIVNWKEQNKIKEATDLIYKAFTAKSFINVNIEDLKDLNTRGNYAYISFGKDVKEILETDFCRGKKLKDVSKLIVVCIIHKSVTRIKIDKVMEKIYRHIKTDIDIYFGLIISDKLSTFEFLLIGT